MAGPASPGGGEGPSFAPPPLPAGWIAQWDGASRKYYFVQLSTGISQWETPTDAAPVGGGTPTPSHADTDHPFGIPNGNKKDTNGSATFITHPDGSQTIRHADGRMEPVMPSEDGSAAGTRGIDGQNGERGLGSFAASMLQSQLSGQHGSSTSSGSGSNALLGQLIGGLTHSGGSSGTGGSSGSSGLGGKLVGQLASNLFSSNSKPSTQNYHGNAQAHTSNSGGLAGSMMGGVANMFGGHHQQQQNQGYGYSGAGQSGTYSGAAPPTSYQSASHTQYNTPGVPPSSMGGQPPNGGTPSYAPPPSSVQGQAASSQYPPYGGQPQQHQPQQHQPQHQQNHPPPPQYQQYQPQQHQPQQTPQSFPPPPGQQQHQPYQPQQHQQQQSPYGNIPPPPPAGYGAPPGGQPGTAGGGGGYSGTPGYFPPPPAQAQQQHHQQPPPQYGQSQYAVSGGQTSPYGGPQQNVYAESGGGVPPGGYGGNGPTRY